MLPKTLSPEEFRAFQINETYIEFDVNGGPVRLSMDGTRSKPTGLAQADGSWLSYGDFHTPSVLHSPPSDPVAAWKRWLDYAKADLALTMECFEVRKARLLNKGSEQQYANSANWRKVYGDEPGDAEEMLKVLAARVRECRVAIADLEAVTPTSLVEERELKRQRAEEDAASERRRQERLTRIHAINV